MANPDICDLGECVAMLGLGSSITDADRGLLQLTKGMVENQIRDYLGHNITQPTTPYTHYLPTVQHNYLTDDTLDVVGNRIVQRRVYEAGETLQLPQIYARNDASLDVYEDPAAYGGQGASDFAASTQLTKGTHYYLDVDSGTLSKSGQLIRIGGAWSSGPRTVKVTYNAGFTAAELDGAYSGLKFSVIEEICHRWSAAKSRQGADGKSGPVQSESIGGKWSVSYDTSAQLVRGLSTRCMRELQPYKSYGQYVTA